MPWPGGNLPDLRSPEYLLTSRPAEHIARARALPNIRPRANRSEEHTSELQSPVHLVCRLLLEKKNKELFARGERYNETRGIHAAELTDGEVLRFHAEDIGRHNAVDKSIRASVLAREPVTGRGL